HSWDCMNFRSPGISCMTRFLWWFAGGILPKRDARARRSCVDLARAVAHERRAHDAHRHPAAADGHFDAGLDAGRDARERDRAAQRGRKAAGQDLALALRRHDPLSMTEDTLLVHDQTDHHAMAAFGLLAFQRAAADEVAPFVERDGPAES